MHQEPTFTLEIEHADDYEACEDNLAYAAWVHGTLGSEVEVALRGQFPSGYSGLIYDDALIKHAAKDGEEPTQECYLQY